MNTNALINTDGCEIHIAQWCKGVGCAYTGRVAPQHLRTGPGQRRVCATSVLAQALGIHANIIWLNQTHSVNGIDADALMSSGSVDGGGGSVDGGGGSDRDGRGDGGDVSGVDGDGGGDGGGRLRLWSDNLYTAQACDYAWARSHQTAIAISVADCVPVAFYDASQQLIGLCHAGWRGLAQNVIGLMLAQTQFDPRHTRALIGPHICQDCFEISADTRHLLISAQPDCLDGFKASPAHHRQPGEMRYLCDLNLIARRQIERSGITDITNQSSCTRCTHDQHGWCFPSHRRDRTLKRTAMLIWHNPAEV
ncbi:MAG: polyphenol oxidase family protein [Gammaproteobacteria bacterium]|nr:polyphenol oxidase family protein [Gammaproteobacteria bacterium]